jgi:hypothetical protein
VVYKRKGEDKNVRKIEKPGRTPVTLNTKDKSEFFKNVSEEKIPTVEIPTGVPIVYTFDKNMKLVGKKLL